LPKQRTISWSVAEERHCGRRRSEEKPAELHLPAKSSICHSVCRSSQVTLTPAWSATHMSEGCVAIQCSLVPRIACMRLMPPIAEQPLPGSRLIARRARIVKIEAARPLQQVATAVLGRIQACITPPKWFIASSCSGALSLLYRPSGLDFSRTPQRHLDGHNRAATWLPRCWVRAQGRRLTRARSRAMPAIA